MIERDKEYYNQKISELYAVIENQEKIIRDLQEENKQLKSVNSISKRTLYKMNKDRLDANLKLVNENEKIRKGIMDLVDIRDGLQQRIDKAMEYIEDWLFDAGGNGAEMPYEDIDDLLEILKGKE